jgi:hypothetical protein
MCFGSAFIAANASQQFKVRKVFLTQNPQHGYLIKLNPVLGEGDSISEDENDQYYKEFPLYKKTDYLGQKKSLSLTYDRDLEIKVFKVTTPEEKMEHLQTIRINGIQQYHTDNVKMEKNTTKPKVTLSFELSRSHIFKFVKAEAKVEETYEFNTSVPVETVDTNSTVSDSNSSTNSSADNETVATNSTIEYEVKTEIRNRTHSLPLYRIDKNFTGAPILSFEQHQKAAQRLRWYDNRDQEKIRTDKAKNDFEAIIYSFRDWLREESNIPFVGEAIAEAQINKLGVQEEWLEGDGDLSTYDEYTTRFKDLNTLYSQFKERKSEFHQREGALT